MYHGEGTISHCSGVSYSGLWANGKPAGERDPPSDLHSSAVWLYIITQQQERQWVSDWQEEEEKWS